MILSSSERIQKAYNFLKSKMLFRTQEEAADMMRVTRPTFSAALNGRERRLTAAFMNKFCNTFGYISYTWLLTGEGEMLIDAIPEEPAGTLNDRNALKYYYDMDVTASNIGDASDNEQHAPFRLINLPGFEGCVGFNVVGESMLPTARPRDIAAIDPRPVEIIANGEVYLLVTRDGQRMVKRLMRTPDGVRCISDNNAVEWYAPFDVEAAMIVNAYRVRGFISITNLV